MARISELHYSNAYAQSSGVSEFLEVALGPSEDASHFTVSFYQADGTVGIEIPLNSPGVQVSVDPENGEVVYVISADNFPIFLTDPDGSGSTNYEAYALTNTVSGSVIDFYDIGGGTQNIVAQDGLAAGETSQNLAVLVGPEATTTTLQFNQPNPDTLTYESVGAGDTGLACFVLGTEIETPNGPLPIEMLAPGDLVLTRDNGARAVRWIGQSVTDGTGPFAPIRIRRGTLGAVQDVLVSPQHRVLVSGWQAELLFGEDEILVPAKTLINDSTITPAPCSIARYVHILFDRHEIVTTSGMESESFFPGPVSMAQMQSETAEEIYALFPDLRVDASTYGPVIRPLCKPREAQVLTLV
ncbi:Hint domain-containing protein [Thalassococcus sp. S3]|uniref:Hint domain-containing protein n=1 Tax=Thalassococcus sp. S3 TaxID=2017482 RepID=UPI0010246F7E|nr:Hint domain-containing protein [Thalassococcus sp. S3]QBF33528.1 type I secretion protein [Thalassococcus sp. S3]